MQPEQIASFIDHTLLKPDADEKKVEKVCREAVEYGFKGVCVNPAFIALAAQFLEDTDVLPVAVVGFPLGANQTSTKAFEAKEAVAAGAKEIDMVINISALKAKDYRTVFEDIQAVAAEIAPVPLKAILETCYLTEAEKIIAAALAQVAGAAFLKTSTGFAEKGATIEDVALLKSIAGKNMKIKAAGGIRTGSDARRMIKAGAHRIGASGSVKIVREDEKNIGQKRF